MSFRINIALILLLSNVVLSCHKSDVPVVINDIAIKRTPDKLVPQKTTPQYLVDSVTIAGKNYKVVQAHPWSDNELPLCIVNEGDTIYRHKNRAGNGFSFEDFDTNGEPDIVMHQLSNIGGVKEWITFDSKANCFRKIKDFELFPGAERLPGTKYFYSDHRMGCAGGMVGSELFYIDNYEAKAIANIIIVHCLDAEYPLGVSINKIEGGNGQLIEHLAEVPVEYSSEANFYRRYWGENNKRFE